MNGAEWPLQALGKYNTFALLNLIPTGINLEVLRGLFYIVPETPKDLALQECFICVWVFFMFKTILEHLDLDKNSKTSIESSHILHTQFPVLLISYISMVHFIQISFILT